MLRGRRGGQSVRRGGELRRPGRRRGACGLRPRAMVLRMAALGGLTGPADRLPGAARRGMVGDERGPPRLRRREAEYDASRPSASELVHIDPPKTWGVRGTDGPIRAAV